MKILAPPPSSPWRRPRPPRDIHAADEATVSILHGVPGATVDVYANGDSLLTDFKPGTLTDLGHAARRRVRPQGHRAGAGADGDAVIEANDVAVPAGANITVVAHLDASGKPVLTPFVNDTSPRRGSGPHHRPAHRGALGGRAPTATSPSRA